MTETFAPHFFIKQKNVDCIECLMRGYQFLRMKHLEVNIQKIIIMFWVEEFQEVVHFIIIDWFYWSGVCIWNIFRIRFNWEIWRVNLKTTIINGIIIKSTHDIWNHKTGFWRKNTGFEVSCWRLALPISWWISWFITMKGVEYIHLSSKTRWEEFRATDDSVIILVYNPSTAFTNNLLYHAKICNSYLETWCIIIGGRWSIKTMRALTWSHRRELTVLHYHKIIGNLPLPFFWW